MMVSVLVSRNRCSGLGFKFITCLLQGFNQALIVSSLKGRLKLYLLPRFVMRVMQGIYGGKLPCI